ncbi:MAG TPA: response regulator [Caldithrix abyssi]|uniref:histidine kinase n=1 Tax=Caldithrix abyssi TaxID=187145 RepID=A0A7V1LK90_CALAY|nr:response regulator [Caldithrix abyssi]
MKSTSIQFLELLHDGFCATDLNGIVLYANPRALELIKLEDYTAITLNFFRDVVKDENLIEEIKSKIAQESSISDIECNLFNRFREYFPVILTANYIRDYDGTPEGYLFLFKEMSAFKEMQVRLVQAQKMESIGLLASGIAHEFNNILSGIMPNAELIKMTTKEKANLARADMIHKASFRAANIVKQLLSFARIHEMDETEALVLNEAVSETLGILDKLFGKEIHLENRIPVDLPAIEANATQLQQVIMNLAINARDALEGSGRIIFSAEVFKNISKDQTLKPGDYIVLKVMDNGHGMTREVMEKIFDPFFTTKEPGKGTGLGLSTVYGIVKSLNGDIRVESEPDKGTRFNVYLPVSHSRLAKQESPDEVTESTSRNVMIIDDDLVVREMAGDLLDFLGHTVVKAETGEEGIELFRTHPSRFDLIIIDLIMPKMNGVTTMERIRAIDEKIKIVITSGVGHTNKKDEMLKKGADAYLQKPYSLDAFRSMFSDLFPE